MPKIETMRLAYTLPEVKALLVATGDGEIPGCQAERRLGLRALRHTMDEILMARYEVSDQPPRAWQVSGLGRFRRGPSFVPHIDGQSRISKMTMHVEEDSGPEGLVQLGMQYTYGINNCSDAVYCRPDGPPYSGLVPPRWAAIPWSGPGIDLWDVQGVEMGDIHMGLLSARLVTFFRQGGLGPGTNPAIHGFARPSGGGIWLSMAINPEVYPITPSDVTLNQECEGIFQGLSQI